MLGQLGFTNPANGLENRLWFWLSSWLSLQPKRRKIGGDGWESNPPRTPRSAPQTGLKTAGGTSPRSSPAVGYVTDDEPPRRAALRALRSGRPSCSGGSRRCAPPLCHP